MMTTWSTSNKNSHATVSGGDLVATADTSGIYAPGQSDGATIGSGDKKYWEVTITAQDSGSGSGIGIINNSANFNDNNYLGVSPNSLGYYPGNGAVLCNGTLATIQTGAATHVVGIAFDFNNAKIWFRIDGGNWNNSGGADPASNSGGITVGSQFQGANVVKAAYSVIDTTTQASWTANFGATTFAHAAPSGFTGFDSNSVPVTWDPAAHCSSVRTVAFSGANLVATFDGPFLTNVNFGFCGRATQAITSGQKKYWETIINGGAIGESGVGIIGTGTVPPWPTDVLQEKLLGQAGGVAYVQGGNVWASGTQQATFESYGDGDVIGIAVDFNAQLVWFRVNSGNWNNNGSANPATGTAGFDYSGFISTDVYPGYQVYWDNDNYLTGPSNATAIFDAGSFNHAAPSGFSAL